MKKHLLIVGLIAGTISYGQSVSPQVVASSGDFFTTTSAQLSWTLGEIMTETYTQSSNQITQGFHQPELKTNTVEEYSDLTVSLYPNPTTSQVVLTIPENQSEVMVSIYDVLGNKVLNERYVGNGPQSIDLTSLPNGIYFMDLRNENGLIKTIKIQKTL